jgi:hypothetical protein
VQAQDQDATDQSQEVGDSSQLADEASVEESEEDKQRRENEESERLCRQLMAEEVRRSTDCSLEDERAHVHSRTSTEFVGVSRGAAGCPKLSRGRGQ